MHYRTTVQLMSGLLYMPIDTRSRRRQGFQRDGVSNLRAASSLPNRKEDRQLSSHTRTTHEPGLMTERRDSLRICIAVGAPRALLERPRELGERMRALSVCGGREHVHLPVREDGFQVLACGVIGMRVGSRRTAGGRTHRLWWRSFAAAAARLAGRRSHAGAATASMRCRWRRAPSSPSRRPTGSGGVRWVVHLGYEEGSTYLLCLRVAHNHVVQRSRRTALCVNEILARECGQDNGGLACGTATH